MADWWTELESEILNCLEHAGAVTPAEIGRRLGISEGGLA
jgi:winged helix-turn-helix DNA-binding protein